MSFLLRIIIALIIYFGVQFYFVKKTSLIIKRIFPHFTFDKLKYLKRIFIICLNIYPLSVIFVWGYYLITNDRSFTPPEGIIIDYLAIYPFWVFFTLVLQVFLFYLASDLIKFLAFPIYRKLKYIWKIIEARILFIILIVFAIYIPSRINYDLSNIDVRELTYSKADLNNDLVNLKIVLISDIQVDRYTNGNRLEEFINKVNNLSPDLVLIAGDVITSTPKFIITAAENIGKLTAKYGIYACIGDHDNWAYRGDSQRSIREVTDALQKFDVPMIDNETRQINIDNAVIGITFLTNTYVERISEPLLDSLTNGNKNYDLKILLTHQPRENLIKKASEYSYDMYLAGHTHGGQITLLFPFFNLSPTLIETNLVRGDFWFDKMLLVVTPGLGLSLAPIRYNSTPEITVIKLSDKEYQ